MLYHYDENGSIYAISHSISGYGETRYYLLKNLQGDVVQILDYMNGVVANYEYDAWGNVVSVTAANGNAVAGFALINPIRYRGYYYDSETGFYYLKSRYYDPANCRFISADNVVSTDHGTTNLNLFAYCGNEPVNRIDDGGHFWNTILGAVAGAIVGGVSAALAGEDIMAGVITGAAAGAAVGLAVDITLATCGAAAGVAIVSTVGAVSGGASSYANQRLNGVAHEDVNWGDVLIDSAFGAVGGALSWGTGTRMTLKTFFSTPAKKLAKQAVADLGMNLIIGEGTWLNSSKFKMINALPSFQGNRKKGNCEWLPLNPWCSPLDVPWQ